MSVAKKKAEALTGAALINSVLELKPTKVQGAAIAAVDRVLKAAKTMLQSANEFEKELHIAAVKCLEHCEEHGDAMPMDRLVKGLQACAHPITTRFMLEVVAWAKGSSPIYWDAQGNVHVRKKGEEGYKDFDVQTAEEVPFNETAMAKRARELADKTHKNNLKEVDVSQFQNRVKGLRHFLEGATKPDKNGQVRGIKKGDKKKLFDLMDAIETAAGIRGEDDKTEGKPQREAA